MSFPFTDLPGARLRPALLVSRPAGDDVIVAFVTSRTESVDPRAAHLLAPADPEFRGTGLRVASLIRLNKLATLHRNGVRRRIGRIGSATEAAVARALRQVLEK